MGLSGDLRDFDLSEVLQILAMGKKTGILELADAADGGDRGSVWLRDGRVMHAVRAPDLQGVPALMDLLSTARGRFSFESATPSDPETPVTIDRTLEGLLLEASTTEAQ